MQKNLPVLATVLLVLLGLGEPARCVAQQTPRPPSESAGSIAALSVNAFAGAATGALRSLFEDRSTVSRAILKGALGGSVSYAGKRIAVESWSAAPLLGRVINAAGASMVAQAAVPTNSLLDSIQIPLGPVSLHFSARLRPGVSINVNEAVILASALAMDELRFDREYSLKAFTPVFRTRNTRMRTDGGEFTTGTTVGRTIVLDGVLVAAGSASFPHEVVHLLQIDFMQVTWDQPLERAVRTRIPGMNWVPRWLHAGALMPGILAVDQRLGDGRGVFLYKHMEWEAQWLDRHH